ncbi:MAG: heavy metal translocating P-type ATPase [Bacteroidota bacterium]
MSQITEVNTICDHCGDWCSTEIISYDDKHFCCHGCKAVYELLEASNLTNYYQGENLKTRKISDQLEIQRKYGFLDNEKILDQLIRFRDEKISVIKFYLPAIHCSSCIYLLENLPRLNKDIVQSRVNFLKKEATVTFQHESISLKDVVFILSSIGYEPLINLESSEKPRVATKQNHIIKLAVAGFCFGNSMLISLPEYFDTGFQLEESFRSLFGWINLVLMLPVVLYASNDYFISAYKGAKNGFLNIDVPISIGILTLALRSIYEILWHVGPGYIDSLTGLVFFLLIGKWYQNQSYQALSFERDYKSYFPIAATVETNGKEESVLLKDLKPKDILIIHNQELIPADSILLEGNASLDYSFISGESELVGKSQGDKLFSGGRQVGGPIKIQLMKSVNNSELTQLWNRDLGNSEGDTSYQNMVDKVSKYFTIAIMLIALGSGIFWALNDTAKIWDTVTAVLIVACPCALALALPFSYGHGMRILGLNGLYLRNASVIEKLSQVREIVFDKTGTLTENVPGKIHFEGDKLTTDELSLIKKVVSNSAHPLSKLIYQNIKQVDNALEIKNFEEKIGEGLLANVSDNTIRLGSSQWLGVNDKSQNESRVYVEIDGELKGYFAIESSYRKDIFQMLILLKKRFSMFLLSGDSSKERDHLSPYFDELRFSQKPAEKFSFVKELGDKSMMVGDGLNDAGALKAASVGIAVSEDIHQFSPSCDGILAANKLEELLDIMRFSGAIRNVLIAAFIISFTYNLVGLSFAVSGNLSPIVSAIIMPISSVTVVGFITLAVNYLGKHVFKNG